jgi:ADP-ribose diphosphatase
MKGMKEPELPPRRIIFKGSKLDLALQPLPLADGSISTREVVVHRGAVALLPMLDNDHVCLIRNFRHTIAQTLLEVPAGTLEAGEEPAITASRELQEETGYSAARVTHLTSWWVSPGVMTEQMHLYLCEGLTAGTSAHQPDERIEVVVTPWSDAIEMAMDGRISDAKTKLAILWFERHRHARGPGRILD